MKTAAPKAKSKTQANAPTSSELRTLVLQGGGALGAYQAGVYEALDAHGMQPQWVAGISIGAINAAIIAGNPPERRVARLREFWEGVSAQLNFATLPKSFGSQAREMVNESCAAIVATLGVPGFFMPRVPPGPFQMPGTRAALSYYDTAPLARTLEQLIDFDLLNTKDARYKVRLSVGAVHVTSGNFRYFDSTNPDQQGPIDVRHIMASGALPPGFPPIEIDGESYWDGGLVSNTPLQYVIDQSSAQDMLVLQVDLFNARGKLPRNLGEVNEREMDIRFASRTRLNTELVATQQKLSAAAQRLAAKLPPEMLKDPDLAELLDAGSPSALTIVHLIYRNKHYDTPSKDYDFSRQSMLEHWAAGQADVRCSLDSPLWTSRTRPRTGVSVLDLTPGAGPRGA